MVKHISRGSFRGNEDNGKWIMPVTKYVTYCREVVSEAEIDNDFPTCDECMDVQVWEKIDNMTENEYQGTGMDGHYFQE